ncbi:MAG: PDZ domain-containing protein [Armatimonadetes bacterium]|nr:PDZ domain-containing protein [Armatimonadota bacterium]
MLRACFLLLLAIVLALSPRAGWTDALTLSDLDRSVQEVLAHHPAAPHQRYLVRASLRGVVERLHQLGLEGSPLFRLDPGTPDGAVLLQGELQEILGRVPAQERDSVIRAGIQAMIESLDDPGSSFFGPGLYQKSLEELGYSLGGVGFHVDEEPDAEGRFLVIEMLEGFPAEKLGIRSGDRLVGVGGRSTRGLSFKELASLVRGPVGTRVDITIQRGGQPPRSYTVVREWLNPNPKGYQARMLAGGVGYIKLKYLGLRSHLDVRQLVDGLIAQGAKSLVLDLRNCPGDLEGSAGLADLFLGAGVPVYELVSGEGREPVVTETAEQYRLPLAILVNRYTEDAGAVVAGALRDHGRAVLIGQPTEPAEMEAFKRLAHELPDGSVATITVSYVVLPLGKSLWKDGLRPDLPVPARDPAAEATGGPEDAALQRALNYLTPGPSS